METRIVIFDNDMQMQTSFAANLSGKGWDVLTYRYNEIDLLSLSQVKPSLIILNFAESNAEDAWSFLQMLKMDDTTAKIPVLIAASLNPLTADIHAYLTLQNIQVIYIPFELDSFIQLVQDSFSLASEAAHPHSHDKTMPILVVEDDKNLREGLAEILNLSGYQVVTADNGLMALEAVYSVQHSFIFLDIQMPVMDGFEFLQVYGRQLRRHRPVVILSADITVGTRDLPAFVVDILSKPYEINDILKVTEKYAQII